MVREQLPDDAARRLAELLAAASGGEKESGRYENALRAFNAAGWSWRQLGDALDLTHEAIRKRAARPPVKGAKAAGFRIPRPAPKPKKLNVIPAPALPAKVAKDLKARLDATGNPDTGERTSGGLRPEVADFFAGLQAAREAGWDNYTIGPAIGLHPRAVSRFAARHEDIDRPRPDYPPAKEDPREVLHRAKRPVVPAVEIPAADADLMRDNDQDGVLLGRWYLHGASREALAAAVGQDWETVRKRLVRRGLMAGRS